MAEEQIIEEKDVFTEILEEEIDEEALAEEEAGKETEEEEEDKTKDKTEVEEEEEPVTIESLQEQIKELTKESKGRYKDLKTERTNRQGLETKLSNLEGRLSQITDLFSKAKGIEKEEEKPDEVIVDNIPVSFTEEGTPYIDPKHLKKLDLKSGDDKGTAKKVEDIEAREKIRDIDRENTRIFKNVLSADDAYPDAYKKLGKAYEFLDEKITEIFDDRGLEVEDFKKKPDPLSEVLDLLEGSEKVVKEFQIEFPGIDMETVIEARNLTNQGNVNTRKLKKALNALKTTKEEETPDKDKEKKKLKKLKTITKKGSNLSGIRNQKGSAGITLDDIADIEIDDFMNLGDDQVKKLERLLYEEEVESFE